MTGTRAVIAAAGVALVLGVGACSSDDPEPRVAPTPSGAVETTATAATKAASIPAAAQARTDDGAVAFVQYFIDVLNAAQRTGDTSTLADLSSDACAGCRGYVKAIRAAYKGGGHIEGGEITIGRLRELPRDYGADWGGYARSSATPQKIYDGDGAKRRFPGGPFPLYVYTKWFGDHWAVQWIRTPA